MSESASKDYLNRVRAEKYVQQGHFLTKMRRVLSVPCSATFISFGRNWGTASFFAALASTDARDGHLVRKGEAICPGISDGRGKIEDPRADKWLFYSMLAGSIINNVIEERYRSAAIKTSVLAVSGIRDVLMHHKRYQAADEGKDVGAILPSRIKTVLHLGFEVLDTTPIANDERVSNIVDAGLVAGTLIGLEGYRRFSNQMENQAA